MISPILPPTLKLEGASHLDLDCKPMLATDTRPVPRNADQESGIWVTREVEVKNEVGFGDEVKYAVDARYENNDELFRIHPSNKWKLCYIETDEIEAENADWDKIDSTLGIYVLGKRLDRLYEVVVDESLIPWLRQHEFRFLDKAEFELKFCYDPTQPTEIELQLYGWGAFYFRFLQNSSKAFWSRRSQELESCLRSLAPSAIQTAIEWAILSRDILTCNPLVQKKFALYLVLLALSLVEDYNAPSAIQLLEKDQDGVMQAFHQDLTDLFKATERRNRKAELHIIGLTRCVFILAGGPEDVHQLKFDHEYTAIDNINLLGSLVGITGSSCFGNLDLQAVLGALSRSKAFTTGYIDALDITNMINKLTNFLPIGCQSNLVYSYCGLNITDVPEGRPTQVPLKIPLLSGHCAPLEIFSLQVPIPGNGVHELKKVSSSLKLRNGDLMKLQLDSIVPGSTPQILAVDVDIRLSSSLEEDKLVNLLVEDDGWHGAHRGTQQCHSAEVLRIEVGQRVLITEEQENRHPEKEEKKIGRKRTFGFFRTCKCRGILQATFNVPFHQATLEKKLRSIRQCIKKRLEDPRVASSACGLGRVFSLLSHTSDHEYEALSPQTMSGQEK